MVPAFARYASYGKASARRSALGAEAGETLACASRGKLLTMRPEKYFVLPEYVRLTHILPWAIFAVSPFN